MLAVPWRGVPLQAPTLATWQAQRQPFLCPPLGGSLSPGDQGERLSFLTQSGFPARKQHPARCVQLLLGDFKELHPPPVGAWFGGVSTPPRSGARSQALLERGRRLAASPALPWGSGEPGGVGSCEDVKERVGWDVP